jgi:hypothetical protein
MAGLTTAAVGVVATAGMAEGLPAAAAVAAAASSLACWWLMNSS